MIYFPLTEIRMEQKNNGTKSYTKSLEKKNNNVTNLTLSKKNKSDY
jgi:hypothetical protein